MSPISSGPTWPRARSFARRTLMRWFESIDNAAALAAPGVIAVLTGEDVAADGLGSLPCGWGISGNATASR